MSADLPPGLTVLERGWLSSNNVVLLAPDGHQALLVDTGYVSHSAQTVALVEAALAGRPLSWVVNTHLHSDHCGGNAAVSQRFGADILVPPGDYEAALHWDMAALSYEDTGQQCAPFTPAGCVQPGSCLPAPFEAWEVHAAPGHDPSSVILFEPHTGVLMSADALWEDGFGIVFPELNGEAAFAEVEATLTLIAALQPRYVIPGHGAPFGDVAAALGRARQRLAYFRREPARHARHAAKALLMFHLLERGAQRRSDVVSWALATPVFQRMCRGDLAPAAARGAVEGQAQMTEELLQALLDAGLLNQTAGGDGSAVVFPA